MRSRTTIVSCGVCGLLLGACEVSDPCSSMSGWDALWHADTGDRAAKLTLALGATGLPRTLVVGAPRDGTVGREDSAAGRDREGRVLVLSTDPDISCSERSATASDAQIVAVWPTFGTAVVVVDLDGDGVEDLVVGSPEYSVVDSPSPGGRVDILYGASIGGERRVNPESTNADHVVVQHPDEGRAFGGEIVSLGDIDDDGFDDVGIGSQYGGGAWVMFGGPRGSELSAESMQISESGAGGVWHTVRSVGDFTGDKVPDIALISESTVVVYSGGSEVRGTLLDTESAAAWAVFTEITSLSWTFSGLNNDLDQDGDDEAWLWAYTDTGSVGFVLPGGAYSAPVAFESLTTIPGMTRLIVTRPGEPRVAARLGTPIVADVASDDARELIVAQWLAEGVIFALSGPFDGKTIELSPEDHAQVLAVGNAGDALGSAFLVATPAEDGGIDVLASLDRDPARIVRRHFP